MTSKKKATIDETDANNKLLMKEDKAKPNTEGRRSDVQEDEISRYYSSHPEYQQSMKAHLSCRVGAELIRHGIKLSKKPPVMDILMKNPTPEEKDFEGVCTADVAKLLMQVPADYIKMQREATYRQELKLH